MATSCRFWLSNDGLTYINARASTQRVKQGRGGWRAAPPMIEVAGGQDYSWPATKTKPKVRAQIPGLRFHTWRRVTAHASTQARKAVYADVVSIHYPPALPKPQGHCSYLPTALPHEGSHWRLTGKCDDSDRTVPCYAIDCAQLITPTSIW